MLTRLKNGSYLDLSLVVGLYPQEHLSVFGIPQPWPHLAIRIKGYEDLQRIECEDPKAYAAELAALAAKAQGSGQ